MIPQTVVFMDQKLTISAKFSIDRSRIGDDLEIFEAVSKRI